MAISLLTFVLASPIKAAAATPAGTTISNIADVTYVEDSFTRTISSNQASFTTRSPATIEFLQFAPTVTAPEYLSVHDTYYISGTVDILIPPPTETATQPVPLTTASVYHVSEDLYLRLTDLDQNLDLLSRDVVQITVSCTETGDTETLKLTETDINTGVFVGYLPMDISGAAATDGVLIVTNDTRLTASYTDPTFSTDIAIDAALIDPYGRVFDSATGAYLDGASVTLWDEDTNDFAVVFGDDGISLFPANIVTGATITDSGSNIYDLPTGGFRFPFVEPGNYRLIVTPPAGYTAPSVVDDALLQNLPNAPFALVNGSRGEIFTVNPGPAIHIDIPADPEPTSSEMRLIKEAAKDRLAIGDFIQYRLTLYSSSDTSLANTLTISDRLPPGFRYQAGSLRINGTQGEDPSISSGGRSLLFTISNSSGSSQLEISYVTEVSSGAKVGLAKNTAIATDSSGNQSNEASATVRVENDFFSETTFITGRVMTGECSLPDSTQKGLSGIRIYLEDGRYSVTDKEGKYHFEGVEPGVHVVQIDTASLPQEYTMSPCEQTSQYAGRTFSQFVDLQGGTLWEVNFHAAQRPQESGEVKLSMSSRLTDATAIYRISLNNGSVPTKNLRLSVMLPPKSEYIQNSSIMNGARTGEPDNLGQALIYRIGDAPANWSATIELKVSLDIDQPAGEIFNKALLTFDTATKKNQRTPFVETSFRINQHVETTSRDIELYPHFPTFVSEMQSTDRVMLDKLAEDLNGTEIVRIDVTGHTDNVPIARRSQHLFADNFALSLARAQNVAEYLARKLGVSLDIMTVSGLAETLPVADNATEAGRVLNRRVDLIIQAKTDGQEATIENQSSESGVQSVKISQEKTGPPAIEKDIPETDTLIPEFNRKWLNNTTPGSRWLWPQEDSPPAIPSTKLVVMHKSGAKITMLHNGRNLHPITFEGAIKNEAGWTISQWAGVGLTDGSNRFQLTVEDRDGNIIDQLDRDVHYSTAPAYIEVLLDQSTLIADGLTAPRIALRVTDATGYLARKDQVVEFEVEPPHSAENDLMPNDLYNKAKVRPNGIAIITLKPSSSSGEVNLEAHLENNDVEFSVWLKPAPRDWILVGFAQGTVGYKDLSGNQVSLEEAGIEEHYYDDGRVKFFAKGAVKATGCLPWLTTLTSPT